MIKVLIAEDEPLSLQNLTGHLRRLLGADALIEGAANGREAVDMARRTEGKRWTWRGASVRSWC